MKPKVTETQERTVTTDNSVRNGRSKGGILEIPTERQKGLKWDWQMKISKAGSGRTPKEETQSKRTEHVLKI